MRQSAMLSFVIAGMFILASAAVAQANWYHKSEGSQESTSEMMSPSGEPEAQAPEAETYGNPQQLETGGLPSEEGSQISSEFLPPGGENAPVVDPGGVKLRIGIDTE